MTSQEFVCWLKGFTEGVHEYNITPKQWDRLKEVLSKVNDSSEYSLGIGVGANYITTTTDLKLLND